MSHADLLITLTAHENDEGNVTIAFTVGMKAIEKGHKVEMMLLSNGIHIAEKGYADKNVIGATFKPIKDLLASFLDIGGKLKVCKSCLDHNDTTKTDIIV